MKILAFICLLATLVFGKIDINSADSKSLQSIKGIGAKTAERIIEYRGSKCFESIEEIVKVKGIGKKTLEKISPMIEALPCESNTTK